MTVQSEKVAEDRVVLRFEDTFDPSQVWRLSEIMSKVAPGTHITLDFSQVREFHDVAFARLAQEIIRATEVSSHVDLSVRGLRQHQLRILKYLGVTGYGFDGRIEDDLEPDIVLPGPIPFELQ